MALFLQDHSTAKIMILGRWSSAAFLRYIRPQVMEWTADMSTQMVDTSGDFRHAMPSITQGDNSGLTPLQVNVEAAMESPEQLKFDGSVSTATFNTQLNLEY